MKLEVDDHEFQLKMRKIDEQVLEELIDAMNDAVDDLVRISSSIAPIDKGILRKSSDRQVKQSADGIQGEVSYQAVEQSPNYGRFDYAIWTHEYMTGLGPRSQASPGTDGYVVGRKYLTRPLQGESPKYVKWFQEALEKGVDG
ncbi:hypothetical protein SAMN04487866_10958 [Thermoactinomyces sp. DSM 45891]|uniref:HK97 gp10 family phage protein n=1 Tax=Thermoactinomyces sp. DSM 45891 TaxID=1761907 RepID=UPI00091410CE|nr:HK97 gp10 family phage protein [Thermoactinomyces sp. DSM 45891]SFX48633.1 hypothetical protein SAMN04487866_10958 [Thermoactinomyces sp. DSM 45891]